MPNPYQVAQNAVYNRPTNFLGVPTSSDTYVSDSLAALTRQQFQDYVSRFRPVEDQVIRYATDVTAPEAAAQRAQKFTQQSYENSQGQFARDLQRRGIQPTADQQGSINRQVNLNEGMDEVGNMNRARQQTRDSQIGLLTGSPTPSSISGQLAVQNLVK